ncbi:MAG TPA: prepilin-type N-terminal cleavage/methylation domain-containing protein [Gemmatimonadaceae bacterium]|nr:prepilin-type N-terminal cleavage/methylation domain-containing protein [Gemmatimonadaceae bacterium]
MRKHTAFTLVEVMVAIVLTGLVALLAYGSAQTGFDTARRLDNHRRGAQSAALLKTFVADALRHLADAPAGGPATFHIGSAAGSSDTLSFVTRGVTPPLGAALLWTVTISPSASGLRVSALPLEDSVAAPIEMDVAELTGISVRVLRVDGAEWLRGWDSARQVPAAVELNFVHRDGSTGAPLLVSVSSDSGT